MLSLLQLLTLAFQIQNETEPSANSAERVGSFLVSLVKSIALPYQASQTYQVGQYVFFSDSIYRCLANTLVNESPTAAPTKWKLLTTSLSAILTQANDAQKDSALLSFFTAATDTTLNVIATLLKNRITTGMTAPTLITSVAAASAEDKRNAGIALLSAIQANADTYKQFCNITGGCYPSEDIGTDTGSGSTGNPPVTTNEPGPPVWDMTLLNASKPKLIPGSQFVWDIAYSLITIPDGATFTGVALGTHPGYLSLVGYTGGVRLYGTVPLFVYQDVSISLNASESYTLDGLTTGKSATANVTLVCSPKTPYANYKVDTSPNQTIVRFGPYFGAGKTLYLTLTDPNGNVVARHAVSEWGVGDIGGYQYNYQELLLNAAKGIWTFKLEAPETTLYGSFKVTDEAKDYAGIGLTDTAPVPVPTQPATIAYMDWYWKFRERQANTNGTQTTVYTYLGDYTLFVKASNGATPELWGSLTSDNVTFSDYQKFAMKALTSDAKGYTHSFSVNSAANVKTLFKIKMVGEDDNKFIYFDLTMPAPPAATTSRVQFYPTIDNSGGGGSGGGSSTTGYGSLVISGSNRQNLSLSIQWSGGKARLVHNNAQAGIYLFSGQPEITSLPTTYDFYPGDEVEIFFIQGQSSSEQFYNWPLTGKAQAIVRFGDAPTS